MRRGRFHPFILHPPALLKLESGGTSGSVLPGCHLHTSVLARGYCQHRCTGEAPGPAGRVEADTRVKKREQVKGSEGGGGGGPRWSQVSIPIPRPLGHFSARTANNISAPPP